MKTTDSFPSGRVPPQDSYLHQFGGSGKNSKGVKETLARHALRSRALEPWFHALSFVVDISPAQAHAIVSHHPSLGQLMAIYADPSRCERMPCRGMTDLPQECLLARVSRERRAIRACSHHASANSPM